MHTTKRKFNVIHRVIDHDERQADVARHYGVSPATVSRWITEYEAKEAENTRIQKSCYEMLTSGTPGPAIAAKLGISLARVYRNARQAFEFIHGRPPKTRLWWR